MKIFKSWYIGDETVQRQNKYGMNRGTGVKYVSPYPKNEFIERVVDGHILRSTGIKFDPINYFRENQHPPKMPKTFRKLSDFEQALRSLTAPRTGFLRYVTDYGINTIHVRIDLPNHRSHVSTMVINRWHDNVNSIFGEENRLNSAKDTLDFIPGSVGSYPNMFVSLNYKELPDFFDLVANFNGSPKDIQRFDKYFISRADKDFWKTYDWFQKHFNQADPLEAGLYDLNRYYRKVW